MTIQKTKNKTKKGKEINLLYGSTVVKINISVNKTFCLSDWHYIVQYRNTEKTRTGPRTLKALVRELLWESPMSNQLM